MIAFAAALVVHAVHAQGHAAGWVRVHTQPSLLIAQRPGRLPGGGAGAVGVWATPSLLPPQPDRAGETVAASMAKVPTSRQVRSFTFRSIAGNRRERIVCNKFL